MSLVRKAKFWIVQGSRLQTFLTFITIFCAFAILSVLVYRERSVLLSYQWQIKSEPALLSFFLFISIQVLVGILWGWIFYTLGGSNDFYKHIQYYGISNVAKRIPGTIWYIASRAQLYKKDGVEIRITSLVSAVEMALIILSGLLASSLFAAAGIFFSRVSPWILVVLFLIGLVMLHPRIITWVFHLFKAEAALISYKNILIWLFAYLIVWILGGFVLFLIGNIVTTIPLANLGYVIGSWMLVGVASSVLFFSPSNFGVTEIGLSILLSQIMPLPVGVVISVLARILLIVYEIIWALILLFMKSKTDRH